jgi:hypothetical protein
LRVDVLELRVLPIQLGSHVARIYRVRICQKTRREEEEEEAEAEAEAEEEE